MVRANAGKWGVDTARVGTIGFSAGAMTVLNSTLTAKPGERPAFIGYIYDPQAAVEVPADAPPMFDAITFDDEFFPPVAFPLVEQWRKARRDVELHAYSRGGHGFGTGEPGTTTMGMIGQFSNWLAMQGFASRKDQK
nr:hypothetical protein [Sphingomonas tagetis]